MSNVTVIGDVGDGEEMIARSGEGEREGKLIGFCLFIPDTALHKR